MLLKELRKATILLTSAFSAKSDDDRMLFRGMLTALSLCFIVAGKYCHSAFLTARVLLLCVSVLEKENVFPSDERSEGEGNSYFKA